MFPVIADAPEGTTVFVPSDAVVIDPVICTVIDDPSVISPTMSDARVSNTRTGAIGTNVDDEEDADTPINPPPPNVTATAAPIAAQRERTKFTINPTLKPPTTNHRTGYNPVNHRCVERALSRPWRYIP